MKCLCNHTEYHRCVLMIKIQNDASCYCIIMIEGEIHTGKWHGCQFWLEHRKWHMLCKLKFGHIVHPSHTLDSLKPSFNTLQFDYPHMELYQGSVSHQGLPLSHHQHTPGSVCSVPAEHNIVHNALPTLKLKSIELSWVLRWPHSTCVHIAA